MHWKTLQKTFTLFTVFLFFITISSAQENKEEPKEDHSYKPLTIKMSEDGKKYVRFIMWHQIWLTSQNLDAENARLQITPSLRRSRFLAFAQVSPRFMILTHFGLNSLTPSNLTSLGNNGNASQFFLHGAWGEYKLHKSIYVGAGLHYWKGMTRLANQSTLNFMTLDQSRPFVSWHSLGITDQFARHLGIFFKGQAGKIDYRLAINNPLRNNIGAGKDYGTKNTGLSYQGASVVDKDGKATGAGVYEGYVRYNFWDTESTKLPYQVGTYLGKKKVLGIGAGFFAHPNGMVDSLGTHSSVNHFAIDAFLDMPVSEGKGAINAYLAFQSFNYGKNYVSRWAGTGSSLYGHLGYYISSAKLMPYIAYQSNDFEGLDDPISALNLGVNYFVNGHNAKITLEYHRIKGDTREGAIATGSDALSQIRLQLHFFL